MKAVYFGAIVYVLLLTALFSAICISALWSNGVVILSFNTYGENLLEAFLLPSAVVIASYALWKHRKHLRKL